MINEPNGERDQGSITIWRTATGLRQWSVKVTENSSREKLSTALQLARELDRRLMRSRPRKKPEEASGGHTVKVRERINRETPPKHNPASGS